MQPSVFSSLAPGQWTLFKWQRFLMARGQRGAWCKVGESGGTSESLLRRCQRLFPSCCPWLRWGLQWNCVCLSIPGRRWPCGSCDRTEALELLVGVWAAGAFGRWEGVWSPSLPLLCCSRGSAALSLHCWWEQSQILWHRGRRFRLPRACSETILHVVKLEAKRCICCLWAAWD